MTVRDTSLEAFQKIKASGKYATQAAAVTGCVDIVGPATRRGLSERTGFELGAICGAVNKLIKDGVLVDWDLVQCPTTRQRVHLVRLAPGQGELFS